MYKNKSTTLLIIKKDTKINRNNSVLAESLRFIDPNITIVENKSSSGINKSLRKNINYKKYYKKAKKPLTYLWENPNNINILGRVRELNKIIINKNKNYQRENKQKYI